MPGMEANSVLITKSTPNKDVSTTFLTMQKTPSLGGPVRPSSQNYGHPLVTQEKVCALKAIDCICVSGVGLSCQV